MTHSAASAALARGDLEVVPINLNVPSEYLDTEHAFEVWIEPETRP
jgi:hypothetical protein